MGKNTAEANLTTVMWTLNERENGALSSRQCTKPCHQLIATMSKLYEVHFELLPHPPYSLDLAQGEYYLQTSTHCCPETIRREEVIADTEAYFEGLNEWFFKKSFKMLLVLKWLYHSRMRLCWWMKSNSR